MGKGQDVFRGKKPPKALPLHRNTELDEDHRVHTSSVAEFATVLLFPCHVHRVQRKQMFCSLHLISFAFVVQKRFMSQVGQLYQWELWPGNLFPFTSEHLENPHINYQLFKDLFMLLILLLKGKCLTPMWVCRAACPQLTPMTRLQWWEIYVSKSNWMALIHK